MKRNGIENERKIISNRLKALFLMILGITIASILIVYAVFSGNLGSSAILMVFAAVLLISLSLFAFRRYRDAGEGIPFEDERSRRVMEKAASRTFFISLYVLLAVGWLSGDIVRFRDVSQATSAIIGILCLVFFASWFYFNRRDI